MRSRMTDLRYKEVINICDGCRFGYVGDAELDLVSGQICALIVPGPTRFFGLFGGGRIPFFLGKALSGLGKIHFGRMHGSPLATRIPKKRRWF
jgi:YlmC/YmxH family sporulation protein